MLPSLGELCNYNMPCICFFRQTLNVSFLWIIFDWCITFSYRTFFYIVLPLQIKTISTLINIFNHLDVFAVADLEQTSPLP